MGIKGDSMKKFQSLFALTSTSLILAVVAASNAEAGRIHNRQERQAKRIQKGVQSGELTNHEQKKLAREERRIQREKKEARSDGVMTGQERRKIERMQDKASADIYRMKHDDGATRQDNQADRIKQGVQSGELTRHEARTLRKEERIIDRRRENMMSDGKLTEGERERLDRMQDKASADIYRKKHNDRERGETPVAAAAGVQLPTDPVSGAPADSVPTEPAQAFPTPLSSSSAQ